MNQSELDVILEKHRLWLVGDLKGERADLRYANLQDADLQGENLRGANLRGANLRGANLQGANLQRANLQDADLRGADLRYADLRGADLQYANLRGADLRYADLQDADLQYADFYYIACPEVGAFIGFKKCRDDRIVKLQILEDAKRSSATSRKCRASKVKVLEITDTRDKEKTYQEAVSNYDSTFTYTVGEVKEVIDFDENRWNECAPGIHFYLTREEAELH